MIIIEAESETTKSPNRQINHMAESETLDRNTIANKSKLGVIFLSFKSLGLNILKVLSSLTLAKLLSPYDYGVYGVLNSWISSLSYFTDIGLHESLIQKNKPISKEEIEGYLALRLTLSLLIALIFSVVIYFLKTFVGVNSSSPFLFLLGFLCLFDALTTLPKVVLQRDLNFKKLSILELSSSLALYFLQILFAFLNFGFWSFFIGICGRYLVLFVGGLHLKFYFLPKYSSIAKLRGSFKTGKHFQANLIIVAMIGIATPAILKQFLPVEVVGIYFWTISLVSLPIAYINNFGNVLFSALSKTQDNFEDSKILISKSCRILVLLISLIFGLGATMGPSLIELLFGYKWALAKDVIALCSISAGFFALKELPNAALGALGKPNTRMKVEFIGLTLLLSLGILSTKFFHLQGFLIYSAFINGIIALILFSKIKDYLERETIHSSLKIILITLFSFGLTRYFHLEDFLIKSFLSFSSAFIILIFLFEKKIIKEVQRSLARR